MEIEVDQRSSSQTVLTPIGRIDAETSQAFRQAIQELADRKAFRVVIDLSAVEFMDSSGLSAMVSGMKALRNAGGNLAICNANPQIKTALSLTMLDKVFTICESVDEAFETLQAE